MSALSETGALLVESTDRLLADLCTDGAYADARAGILSPGAWRAVEEAGLPLVLVPEEAGGLGVAAADAFALIRLTGRHAAPFPIAETMLANVALARAGLPLADGPAALVPAGTTRIAWGAAAATLVVERDGVICREKPVDAWKAGTNPAGLPRDSLDKTADSPVKSVDSPLLTLGALARAAQVAGALERVLELTADHVSTREQFGRPLSKFQVIQHSIALMAGETVAASAAADHAVAAWDRGPEALFSAVCVARARTGESAARASALAHQLHGAIGFTREHSLHRFTTALWSWRDEFGTQAWWTRRLGAQALDIGQDNYWSWVVAA